MSKRSRIWGKGPNRIISRNIKKWRKWSKTLQWNKANFGWKKNNTINLPRICVKKNTGTIYRIKSMKSKNLNNLKGKWSKNCNKVKTPRLLWRNSYKWSCSRLIRRSPKSPTTKITKATINLNFQASWPAFKNKKIEPTMICINYKKNLFII